MEQTAGTMTEEFLRQQAQSDLKYFKPISKSDFSAGQVRPLTEFPDDDKVNSPSHYQSMMKDLNIDCITAMRAAFGNYETAVFCKLNAFKYVWRASSKNGNEDIDKALWYLNKYRELGGENQ